MSSSNRSIVVLLSIVSYVFSAQSALAACLPGEYNMLAPIGTLSGCVDLAKYLKGILETTIGIAGILAVIMIVVCAIQLMASGSAGGKSEAKNCITNALFGVLLAIGSWLLLNTVNPLLLKNTQSLPDITILVTPPSVGPKVDAMPIYPGWWFRFKDADGNIRNSPQYDTAEVCMAKQKVELANGSTAQIGTNGTTDCFEVRNTAAIPPLGETETRKKICGNDSCYTTSDSNVYINNNSCIPPERDGVHIDPGCTNVNGLPLDTIAFIKSIPALCGCKVTITGGTENGHKTHAPNMPIFDLKHDQKMINFIEKSGSAVGPNPSFLGFSKWLYGGYWFTDEGNHFHICKDGIAKFKAPCNKL